MGPQLLRGPLPSGKSNPRPHPLLGGYREIRRVHGGGSCAWGTPIVTVELTHNAASLETIAGSTTKTNVIVNIEVCTKVDEELVGEPHRRRKKSAWV